MGIGKSKIAVIHVAKKKLCLSDDDYHDLLWGVAQVNSSKELNETGFNAVMKRFSELGFKSTFKKRQFGRRPGMATPEQVQLVRYLWKKYTGEFNESSLNHWIEKSYGITNLRFINDNMIGKVITGLKVMTNRKCND